MEIRYKVEINPSYEWSEDARELGISHRELEVFALIAEGYKNKEVAEILHIKEQSVKNHMQHFKKKLGVKKDIQATIIALHKNLIKMRGIYGSLNTEITAQGLLEDFRKLINDEIWVSGANEKVKRKIRVFLLSHGIDVDKLNESKKA